MRVRKRPDYQRLSSLLAALMAKCTANGRRAVKSPWPLCGAFSRTLKQESPYRRRGLKKEKGYDEARHHTGDTLSDKFRSLLRHQGEEQSSLTLCPSK